MKVVINKCFGGFGISGKALRYLYEKNAKCINEIDVDEYYGAGDDWKEKWQKDNKYYINDGDGIWLHKYDFNLWDENKPDKLYSIESYNDSVTRTDPDLIELIESGVDWVNGSHASLTIVEIPDDIEWEIDEYDGTEKVVEKHRSWS